MRRDAEPATNLREYVAAKQDVTDVVRRARHLLRSNERTELVDASQELLVKLAEDRFNLAVVGQFKRGKSSLMNAVIGRDLLPTGLLPLTSVITALRYGPHEGVWLRRQNSRFEQQVSTRELANFVTERGNPGNEKGLVEARVELPSRFLRRGLYFVDTPGVGSARIENTATAYDFLPQADAVVFVTSVEAPLSDSEERFLAEVREHVSKLLIVVNKIDMTLPSEREEVTAYVRTRMTEILESDEIRVFPISAREALEAKVAGDERRLKESGLPEFEAALTSFLANEQGRSFLVGVLDRCLALLRAGADSPGTDGLEIDGGESGSRALRDRAQLMRDRLLAGGPLAMAPEERQHPADTEPLDRAVGESSMGDQSVRHPHGMRIATCPTCAAQSQAVFDFFAHWQHELATSEKARQAFGRAGGFCPAHTWQFQQIAAPQDLSAGYVPLIRQVERALERTLLDDSLSAVASRVGALLQTSSGCTACRVLDETERSSTAAYLETLPHDRAAEAEEDELCLTHLRDVLAAAPDLEVAQRLIHTHVDRLGELVEDMQSYSLKRDAVRRGLINSHEGQAWRRAIVQLAGERTARGVVLGPDEASWSG
jgi:ribosome biogenesis GTPase A